MHESLTDAFKSSPEPRLCVVVPCFNEEESIPALVGQLRPALDSVTGGSWTILFVDDGSTDHSSRLIWELHATDPRYLGARLTRNFGHQAALAAGLRLARGECIGVIDCDLQDPVEILVALYEKVSRGECDVCAGQRGDREEVSWWLQAGYRAFYRLMAVMADHEFTVDSGDFCVFNRQVHRALLSLPETIQVMRGLRSWVGFKQAVINYRRPPRARGKSKYNLCRLAHLAIDNVVSFSTFPLRVATCLGLGMFALIMVATALFLINRFVPSFAPFGYRIAENAGTTTLAIYLSLIAASLFLCLGIMGEYLALVVREVKRRPMALVAEVTRGFDTPPDEPGFIGSPMSASRA